MIDETHAGAAPVSTRSPAKSNPAHFLFYPGAKTPMRTPAIVWRICNILYTSIANNINLFTDHLQRKRWTVENSGVPCLNSTWTRLSEYSSSPEQPPFRHGFSRHVERSSENTFWTSIRSANDLRKLGVHSISVIQRCLNRLIIFCLHGGDSTPQMESSMRLISRKIEAK